MTVHIFSRPLAIALAVGYRAAYAAVVPVSPIGGETVALLPEAQKKIMAFATYEDRRKGLGATGRGREEGKDGRHTGGGNAVQRSRYPEFYFCNNRAGHDRVQSQGHHAQIRLPSIRRRKGAGPWPERSSRKTGELPSDTGFEGDHTIDPAHCALGQDRLVSHDCGALRTILP